MPAATAGPSPRGKASSPARKRKRGRPTETPLLELGPVETASISLHEAIHSKRHFEKLPKHPGTWSSYRTYFWIQGWSHRAIGGLLLLTMFETPLWCRAHDGGYWDYRGSVAKCSELRSLPRSEIVMSNLPILPFGVSLVIEFIFLGMVLCKVLLVAKLHGFFRGVGSSYRDSVAMIIEYIMIILGFSDAFYFTFFPDVKVRIAPFVRFGLATTIPWVQDIILSFFRVLRSIVSAGCFLGGTIVVFAWVATMLLDDMTDQDQYGLNVNQGFENFGNALYTMFVTMTTGNLPDVMIPSYEHERWWVLFWMPYFLLSICIFHNVILAAVYKEYVGQITERIKSGHRERRKGVNATFHKIKAASKVDRAGKSRYIVQFETFQELVTSLKTISSSVNIDEHFMRILFDALDDDKSGTLTNNEFHDMCDVLQTKFRITARDSCIKLRLEKTCLGRLQKFFMTNGSDGPDLGVMPPAWAKPKYHGSPFDVLMNLALGLNVMWLVIESVFDMNDWETPSWFTIVDVYFSFVYVVEVLMKLTWWTLEEYWTSTDNRFDFFSTWVLASGSAAVMSLNLNPDIIRYLNLMRLVRLLKALNNIPIYQETVETISRMLTSCGDVLAMNLLINYFWSAAGLQLFGGQLYQDNPRFGGHAADLGYFGSHEQIYNFNDMGLSMVTMFFLTIGNWNNNVCTVCMALYEEYSLQWWLAGTYFFTFYLGSVCIAFDVFTAFSIDIFNKLEELGDKVEQSDVDKNLQKIQAFMAEQHGQILHIEVSATLATERVYGAMFGQTEEEEAEALPPPEEVPQDVEGGR